MNFKFNGATPCTPKDLAKQLIVESAKLLNNKQRQDLIDIFITLDQASISNSSPTHSSATEEQMPVYSSQKHEDQDEINQEYWSGTYIENYNQEYPEEWIRRTQQLPSRLKATYKF
ncbi:MULTISPECIES: hypothetical protein [unclassified Acinetobacter]|uniref:hypothetical protein n=1 Tax=unclassified Acinetobacter TaxID=196816 RepID=UPI0015D4129A|nr:MULTISPECIES: hypothetical protein [unclassified Acinetobacter]